MNVACGMKNGCGMNIEHGLWHERGALGPADELVKAQPQQGPQGPPHHVISVNPQEEVKESVQLVST